MSDGRWTLRLIAGVGLTAILLAGCNFPAPEPVVQPGRLPRVGEEPQTEEDLSDLQGHSPPDECLTGTWVMTTDDLRMFVATIVPVLNMRVTAGSMYFVFGTQGEYDYGSDGIVIRMDLSRPGESPEKFLKGSAFFETAGTYTTDTGELVLIDNGSMVEFTEWVAVRGSQVASAPGGGPEFSFLPDGPLPYECMEGELVLQVPGPTGAVPMIFKRGAPAGAEPSPPTPSP